METQIVIHKKKKEYIPRKKKYGKEKNMGVG